MLWDERHFFMNNPRSLHLFLSNIDLMDHNQAYTCYNLLSFWVKPSPLEAIKLLTPHFSDPVIRAFALSHLEPMTNQDLELYLSPLCQTLRDELYHNSPLARFLVRRTSHNFRLGQKFVWLLRSEIMSSPMRAQRFCLLLEGFLRGTQLLNAVGIASLLNQKRVCESLEDMTRVTKGPDLDREQLERVERDLHQTEGDSLLFALDPEWEATSFLIGKCKRLDTKKCPLVLVFEQKERSVSIREEKEKKGKRNISALMIKVEDHCVRDRALSLDMLRLLDLIWKQNGLNLELNTFKFVATGQGSGMVELIKGELISNIHRSSRCATFRRDALVTWLKEQNPEEKNFQQAPT